MDLSRRKRLRLTEYDYSQPGAYFVTICTRHKACMFGNVSNGDMSMNDCGNIVAQSWLDLPHHYPYIGLDAFIVMPNHVHGIIRIAVGAGLKPAPTLSEIVRGFKTFSAKRINAARHMTGRPLWQRNYYEHVVRNERELDEIRKYIVENPLKWNADPERPIL